MRRETRHEEEPAAHHRRELLARDRERYGARDVGAKPHRLGLLLCRVRRAGARHGLQRLHVHEDPVQLLDVTREILLGETEACELRDVAHVIRCHGHQSIPRSSPAKAITSRLRPIPSSSKSTVTFASLPAPLTSAMVPEPKVRCVTRAPTT